jgi:hypothetical protein
MMTLRGRVASWLSGPNDKELEDRSMRIEEMVQAFFLLDVLADVFFVRRIFEQALVMS